MMSHNGDKPPDETLHVRNTLLDILCNIDVVYEIQEENEKVVGVFDNENTIVALFEIIKMNITYHKGSHINFPQICADIFSSLPDRFVDDIGYNDYLMDLLFSIPQDATDPRQASCFCQIIERFVSSVPYVLYTYLQQNANTVILLLLHRISLTSYLNSLRYLLDIPVYNKVCWWCDSDFFVDSILSSLEDEEASFNTKELILSIVQRATVFSKEENEGCCYALLQSLLSEDHCLAVFSLLTKSLDQVLSSILSKQPSGAILSRFVNGPMEIANNCFLILSRFFWKYSHGLTAGRGGYNRCFNAATIPIQELMKMGGIKNCALLNCLVKQCVIYLPTLFNSVCALIKCHCEMESQSEGSALLSMAPKPLFGFCEFCYHFLTYEHSSETLLFFLNNGFVDDLLTILEVYPAITHLQVNIVDTLICLLYTEELTVLTTLVNKTNLLEVIYRSVTTKALSSLKSQFTILLQAVASRWQQGSRKGIPRKLFRKVLLSNPFFERITSSVNIFAIYPPLVELSVAAEAKQTSSLEIPHAQTDLRPETDLFTIPM